MSYKLEIFDWVTDFTKKDLPEYATLQELKLLRSELNAQINSVSDTIKIYKERQKTAEVSNNNEEHLDVTKGLKRLQGYRKKKRIILSVVDYNISLVNNLEKEEKLNEIAEKKKKRDKRLQELSEEDYTSLLNRIVKLENLVNAQREILIGYGKKQKSLGHVIFEYSDRFKHLSSFVERFAYWVHKIHKDEPNLKPTKELLDYMNIGDLLEKKPDRGLKIWYEEGWISNMQKKEKGDESK